MILDTNALSAFGERESTLGEILRRQARAAIPVIVPREFRYGIARSRHHASYEKWPDLQLARFEALEITSETAAAYAAVRVALPRSGHRIPANDARLQRLRFNTTWPFSVATGISTGSPKSGDSAGGHTKPGGVVCYNLSHAPVAQLD